MLKQNAGYLPQLIYDGIEPNSVNILSSNKENSTLKISSLLFFSELTKTLNVDDLDYIKSKLNNMKQSKFFEGAYNGKDNLPVMWFFDADNNRYFIVSFGEFQPARYKLYLDGVFDYV